MNNIKQIIKDKGIKQIYICKELDINESVLSLIINGKRKPNQDRLKALARILNVSIKDLYPEVEIKRINYYYIQKGKRMKEDKIMQEVSSFQDVATDFKDVWINLNDVLDYEDKREKEILDNFLGLIINFEKEIQNSLSVVKKITKEKE